MQLFQFQCIWNRERVWSFAGAAPSGNPHFFPAAYQLILPQCKALLQTHLTNSRQLTQLLFLESFSFLTSLNSDVNNDLTLF